MPGNTKSLKEGLLWAHSLRVQSDTVRKAWWQGHEAAGHTEITVSRQREMHSFYSSQDSTPWDGAAHV